MNDIETLYRTHAPAMLRFAWGLSGDRQAAEDIVSEAFVRLLTRAPRIETRTARAYLFVIARNVFLNSQRRRKREVPLESATLDQLADAAQSPDKVLDDRARLVRVLDALRELPERERSALLMRVDHELPYDEIATVLGERVGTVKVWVHRARVRLAASSTHQGENHEDRRDS